MPTKISQLPSAAGLTGAELVPAVQVARTVQATARQIADTNPARVVSVAGKDGVVTLVKSDVGLGNVDNTSDLDKPVSVAVQAKFDAVQAEFDALPTFASAAENAAGSIEGKMVDPLGIREAFNASGDAPVYACRAWVNFKGTGTVAIRASGNVSSITDNGTGDYTVNFTTAMPDANYSYAVGEYLYSSSAVSKTGMSSITTTSIRFSIFTFNFGSFLDSPYVDIAIFR